MVSNIPAEKSEKFISQTIEKLLDGIIPEVKSKEYMIILLATPVQDIDMRKFRLSELYTGLSSYASWDTSFTYQQSDSSTSMASFGVNAGVSAGVQNGVNNNVAVSKAKTDSSAETKTDSLQHSDSSNTNESIAENDGTTTSSTQTSSDSYTKGRTESKGESTSRAETRSIQGGGGVNIGPLSANVSTGVSDAIATAESTSNAINTAKTTAQSTAETIAKNVSKTISKSAGQAITDSIGSAVSNTLGKAVTETLSSSAGTFKGVNLGGNFGANFARSSNVTATVGKSETINQHFTNHTIKHTLGILDQQMKRLEESTALGMWDFAAYVLSEDQNVANNVAHSYLALTKGEKSFLSRTSVNLWRGDRGENSDDAKEICSYLRELRHPIFGLMPAITEAIPNLIVYPSVVTATTSLSGKELAYSLNFPQKSVAGLPVIECAEFGRNITTYEISPNKKRNIELGNIFHMNHSESLKVELNADSLASHTFITGSTGSGKSNTVYKILEGAYEKDIPCLVIEPAKGEYKNIFGNDKYVSVYGTNALYTPMLRINPFSFPDGIHIFEHLDRLVEIFNVCWPMYAAMPAVLKSAIEKAYEDCGWDLEESTNEYGNDLYPTFADVARNIRTIIDSSEYDSENKGAYKGSLLTRLQSLCNGINGQIFTSEEISSEDLFDKNVIIDLSRVGSAETKSLIMGMLVLKLQEHRISSSEMNMPLRHITVLEEAHNLLKRTSPDMSMESGNLLGKSVEMISNAIAEMRTYGEGFIIVDQAPGLLDMSAIRNTNTKIIMRLPDETDRQLVGRAANLNEDQITELAKLPCGVGAVYQNDWIQPVLCKVDLCEYRSEKYKYERIKEPGSTDKHTEDRIHIAELLSAGQKVEKERVLSDIRNKMKALKLEASVQAQICKMLITPPSEPRMTKFAPIMSALFPEVLTAVKEAYQESGDETEWTESANRALAVYIELSDQDQLRRDIIQAVMTEFLFHQLNKVDTLKRWIEIGGLK